MAVIHFHPRRWLEGTTAEREAIDVTTREDGVCFLETDTGYLYYLYDNLWRQIINADADALPLDGQLFATQFSFVPGDHSPTVNNYLLVALEDGFYYVDDMATLRGPFVHTAENLDEGGISDGKGVFFDNYGGVLRLKSLVAGNNITITDNGSNLSFDVSGAVNGSNAGTALGDAHVFKDVTGGNQLNFNGLLGVTGITAVLNGANHEIELNLDLSGLGSATIPLDTDNDYLVVDQGGTLGNVAVTDVREPAYVYLSLHTPDTPTGVYMGTADAEYAMVSTAWTKHYESGEYLTSLSGGGIMMPARPYLQEVTAVYRGTVPFTGDTTLSIVVSPTSSVRVSKKLLSGGYTEVVINCLVESDDGDYLSLVVENSAGDETIYISECSLVVKRLLL